MTTVHELMSPQPITIESESSALAALDLMIDCGIRHLLVLDRHGRLVGIVSLDDLRAALPFAVGIRRPPEPDERALARELGVAEVMTYGPVTTTSKASVAHAAGALARFRIGCLPVVDDEKLVGILSETDLLRHVAGLPRDTTRHPANARAVEFEQLVSELRAERERIAYQLGRAQSAEQSETREEREVHMDPAEHAAHRSLLEIDEPLAALAARRLEALDHALFRASQGRLDTCETCAKPIQIARLRALPGTSLCVRCAGALA